MVKAIPENYTAAHRLLAEGHWWIDYDRGLVMRRSDGKPYRCSWVDRYICIGLPRRIDMPRGTILAHRLIWESVNGPLDPLLTVNHLDGNKQNNRLVNLEAITQSANVLHAFATGLKIGSRGERNAATSITNAQALEIYRRAWSGEMNTKIADEFGVGKNVVYRIRHGLAFADVTQHRATAA